ncbi:hypothetical protein J6A31_09125 [bacterium]|nr:hypothetical protein [bacterium]
MTLLETINQQIKTCEDRIKICDETIMTMQERRNCLTEQLMMLNDLRDKTIIMNEEPAEKKDTRKPKAKKTDIETNKPTTDKISTEDEKPSEQLLSLKDVAEKLNIPQVKIADAVTATCMKPHVDKGSYMFTQAQIEILKNHIHPNNTEM